MRSATLPTPAATPTAAPRPEADAPGRFAAPDRFGRITERAAAAAVESWFAEPQPAGEGGVRQRAAAQVAPRGARVVRGAEERGARAARVSAARSPSR